MADSPIYVACTWSSPITRHRCQFSADPETRRCDRHPEAGDAARRASMLALAAVGDVMREVWRG